MSEKKKRWTLVDTIIVLVAIVAAIGLFKMFGGRLLRGNETTLEVQILLANQEPELGEAIKAAEGETVTLSLTEKDSGTIQKVDVKDAEVMVYDATNGAYNIVPSESRVDIYATVLMDVEETENEFLAGTTPIKVGNGIPFRGKGYASTGTVIVINREEGNANE